MSQDLHPAEGARYLFERRLVTEEGATYDGAIFTPDARFDYEVSMSMSGEYQLTPAASPAPKDLEKRLGNFARQLARASKGKSEDGLEPWPHRVLRWRGPGRG